VLNSQERREVARAHAKQLAQAKGPTAFILPLKGLMEWDRLGSPLHNEDGLAAFVDEIINVMPENVELFQLDAHINDDEFVAQTLAIFDQWCADGVIQLP
jgi:uncharacterized protein (UPF0261 family)